VYLTSWDVIEHSNTATTPFHSWVYTSILCLQAPLFMHF